MAKKNAIIDFTSCAPDICDKGEGICKAVNACNKNLLEQEDPFESPYLISRSMCCGCGVCKTFCPLDAIDIL